VQLPHSPLEAQLTGPSAIVADPNDSSHVVVANADGAWESMNAGSTWTLILDPTKQGWVDCVSPVINAVAFDHGSTLYLGIDCGVVRRLPNGGFHLTTIAARVTALSASQNMIWARTASSLLFSINTGATWSQPIAVPNSIQFRPQEIFSLGAFDDFAYMVIGVPDGSGGTRNSLVIFNRGDNSWTTQAVLINNNTTPTGDGTGGSGVDGRKFVKTFIRDDPNLAMEVGQRLQLFYCAGQDLFQALGLNSDGTVSSWDWIVGTQGYSGKDPVHADMWDFYIDTAIGGKTALIAGDGGVYQNTLVNPYVFPGGGWTPLAREMHTHQVHTITVLPTTPVSRSRLVYATSDNNTWYRGSTPVVLPEPLWQLDGSLGDVSWTIGDAAAPRFALSVRGQENAAGAMPVVFIHFGAVPELLPCALINGGQVKPDTLTRFQFIPSPPSAGHLSTLDAVMMVDLPLLIFDAVQKKLVPIDPTMPLGHNSNGNPVLIRNQHFNNSPDMNTSKGAGWQIEISSFPPNTIGFYVSGSRSAPRYYAFTQSGELLRRDGNNWLTIAKNLTSTQQFGPAFVNPYDQNVLYALTENTVLLSTNGGTTFNPEPTLSALVSGSSNLPMSTVAQIAFNRGNPTEIVVGAQSGLFYSAGNGKWTDRTALVPLPRSMITSVAIDCEAIYASLDARGVICITEYRVA